MYVCTMYLLYYPYCLKSSTERSVDAVRLMTSITLPMYSYAYITNHYTNDTSHVKLWLFVCVHAHSQTQSYNINCV